jgi:hypothetical protein
MTHAMNHHARPRRYLARPWLVLLRPLLRYSKFRDAWVLKGVGNSVGPVLRVERRSRQLSFSGRDRRHSEPTEALNGAPPSARRVSGSAVE